MEDIYAFYRDKDGKIKYASKCYNCAKSCRQSFRSQIICCKNYVDKRGNITPLENDQTKPPKTQ